MSDWNKIIVREYYDVPRSIVALRDGQLFYFYSKFDESIDEYTDFYEVYRLPYMEIEDLEGSWIDLEKKAIEKLPNLHLNELPFSVK